VDQTTSILIGVIAYTAWAAVFGLPFMFALSAFKRAADQAGERSENWIRTPMRDPQLETQRRALIGRFWRWLLTNTIGVLALVAWLLAVVNR
jgi:hypothetical protein